MLEKKSLLFFLGSGPFSFLFFVRSRLMSLKEQNSKCLKILLKLDGWYFYHLYLSKCNIILWCVNLCILISRWDGFMRFHDSTNLSLPRFGQVKTIFPVHWPHWHPFEWRTLVYVTCRAHSGRVEDSGVCHM